jgi:hypothetical protein
VTAVGPAAGQCAGERTLCAVRVSGRRQPIAEPCRAAFTVSASRRPATGTEGKRTCCSARQGPRPGPCDDTGSARDGGAVVARQAIITARDAPPVLEAAKHRRTMRLRRRSAARLCLQGTVRVAVDGRVVNPVVLPAIPQALGRHQGPQQRQCHVMSAPLWVSGRTQPVGHDHRPSTECCS